MRNSIFIAVRVFLVAFVLLGIGYPLLITGIGQTLFPYQANGSLVTDGRGAVVGSAMLGQQAESDGYFHPRPSASDYDPLASGGTNLGPTSRQLADDLAERAAAQDRESDIPADMLTTSASGLDPDISPANAFAQVERVARSRGVGERQVESLVRREIRGRDLGFIGEPRVNVLSLNMALDSAFGDR